MKTTRTGLPMTGKLRHCNNAFTMHMNMDNYLINGYVSLENETKTWIQWIQNRKMCPFFRQK